MQTFIIFLLIACAAAFLYFWRTVAGQYSFYEIANVAGRERIETLKIKERIHKFYIAFDLLVFSLLWLLQTLFRVIWAISGPVFLMRDNRIVPRFSGIIGGKIPKQLYEGDSAQVILTFPWKRPLKSNEEQFGSITYLMHGNDLAYPSLEVELQAAGLQISGEQKQNHVLNPLPAVYTWNISAEKSGNFEIGIITRLYSHPDSIPECVVLTHKIRVTKIAFLTSRQLWVITGIFGIFTATLGVLQALVSLKIILIP